MRKRPKIQKNTGPSFTVAMHPTYSTPNMIAVKIVTYWLYLTLDFIIWHIFCKVTNNPRVIKEIPRNRLLGRCSSRGFCDIASYRNYLSGLQRFSIRRRKATWRYANFCKNWISGRYSYGVRVS